MQIIFYTEDAEKSEGVSAAAQWTNMGLSGSRQRQREKKITTREKGYGIKEAIVA